jgi:predicted RNA binding protein with dsRBD fold (UPF0201 family)
VSFFDSEVVRAEMAEISEMQEEIYHNVYKFFMMNKEEKLQHVNLLQKLLEKQQILYTRISLSDDPEAKEMKKKVVESAAMMGIPEKSDINMIFSNMTRLIETMKEAIDKE